MRRDWQVAQFLCAILCGLLGLPVVALGYDSNSVAQCYGDTIEVRFGPRSGSDTVAAIIPLDVAVAINAFGPGTTFVDPLTTCMAEPVLIQSAYFTFNHKAKPSLGISEDLSWRRMKLTYSEPANAGPSLQANQAAAARRMMTADAELVSNGFLKLFPTDSDAGDYVFPPDFSDRVERFVTCAPTVFDVECSSHIAVPEGLSVIYWYFASEVSLDEWVPLDERVRAVTSKLITQ